MAGNRSGTAMEWLAQRINLTEVVSVLTNFGLLYAALDTRKPLPEAMAESLRRPLPSYSRWPRVLGLITLVLLLWQVFSGGLLSFYYVPSPENANQSVRMILSDVHFGWFISRMHAWGSTLLLFVLVLRLIRFFVQRVYRPPRELVWVIASLLLITCIHADMTGRLLPWTSTAYWSSVRALEVLESVPLYGAVLHFVLGDRDIGGFVMIRSYALHVAVLPLFMLILVFLHSSAIRRVGLTRTGKIGQRIGSVAFRRHIANIAIVATLAVGVLISLAVLWPSPFEGRADPFSTVVGIQPPWYLLAPFGLLDLAGYGWLRLCAGLLLFGGTVVLVAFPFVDGSLLPKMRRGVVWSIGALVVAAWLALTIYGAKVA